MLTIPRISVSGTERGEDTIHQPRVSATPAFKAGRWRSLASHDVVCFHFLFSLVVFVSFSFRVNTHCTSTAIHGPFLQVLLSHVIVKIKRERNFRLERTSFAVAFSHLF